MRTEPLEKTRAETEADYIDSKKGCTHDGLRKRYAYKVTDTVKSAIDGDVTNDPVAKQYIPQAAELKILPEEHIDPIGDDVHTPVKGLVHRYSNRVLFKLCSVCAVYCRYCFRREKVGPGNGVLSANDIDTAIDYIAQNKNIWEVILSGGDPLVLSPRFLKDIMQRLENIQHVQTIRIHSRVPIAAPDKMTDKMCGALTISKPVYIALHINHANEMTKDVQTAIQKLDKAGCVLLSQSVLLCGVNDDPDILADLFKTLIIHKVKPYYLHHPDYAPGTSHFRVSIARGQAIMRMLQGQISGICMPHYMLDIPGGHGKVPINSCYISAINKNTYSVEDPQGQHHTYPPQNSKKEPQS